MNPIQCLVCGNDKFKVEKMYTMDDSDYGAADSVVTAGTFKARQKDNVYPHAHICQRCGYIMLFDRDKTKGE